MLKIQIYPHMVIVPDQSFNKRGVIEKAGNSEVSHGSKGNQMANIRQNRMLGDYISTVFLNLSTKLTKKFTHIWGLVVVIFRNSQKVLSFIVSKSTKRLKKIQQNCGFYDSYSLLTMSLTEFAMVEELAFLIKDNLPCKHLILSMEETLVNFLLDDTSSNGVLELEPMNPYNRLLLHRLADIFGFSHQSVGEGEERHLVLECSSETSIPSILISDLLWQYDEPQSTRTVDLISRRKEGSEGAKVEETATPILNISLEEREEAYLAARKRIFSVDQGETKQYTLDRPQKDPTVARRMIAHALGQSIRPTNLEIHHANTEQCEEQANNVNIQHKEEGPINLVKQTSTEVKTPSAICPYSGGKPKSSISNGSESPNTKKRTPKNTNGIGSPTLVKKEGKVNKDSIREEHIGAAKRIFANALGFAREGGVPK